MMISVRFGVVGLLIAGAVVLFSCKPESSAKFTDLDLLSYGMPIVIKAPDSARVKSMTLGMAKDITVIKDSDFNVQILESDVDTRDIAEIKTRLMDEIKSNPYFHQILHEDAAGFVYDTHVDSNYVNYGFRYIRLQGDKEYVFQQGLSGKFTRDAVEAMYRAVQ
jgi:hypothetical protein